MVPLKCMTAGAPFKYIAFTQFMAASPLLKNTVSMEEWVAATTFVQ